MTHLWGSVQMCVSKFGVLCYGVVKIKCNLPLFSTRNTPILTTCSWGERRSSLELSECMMLSCWLKGPSITRLVNGADLSLWRIYCVVSPPDVICCELQPLEDHCIKVLSRCNIFFFEIVNPQIWRRSRRTSTLSGLERPLMVVEELVSKIPLHCK